MKTKNKGLSIKFYGLKDTCVYDLTIFNDKYKWEDKFEKPINMCKIVIKELGE